MYSNIDLVKLRNSLYSVYTLRLT